MVLQSGNLDSLLKVSESLGELEVTVGPSARGAIAEIRARLTEAAGRQSNGDTLGALEIIRTAMDRLAALAGTLDPMEAALMRLLSERLTAALRLGDKSTVKSAINTMRHKAGDPTDEPNSDW
jgi:hypothetical protein